ncbi:MAG: 4Fe-4S dicluster domain-containing protein [Odoribacter sp.]|nr:4Fe-4S dicluster domain-containing protein [Odoribacter sp.]
MLRKIRITIAAICFTLITLLFLDFTGTIHVWFGWLAKIQFLPAFLAGNAIVVAGLVILTLLLGRMYCSVICPLGVFQDVVSRISGSRKKKKYRFSYSPALVWLRYGVLVVFVIAMITGIGALVALLAPYSAYGRIIQTLVAPLWQWGNNVLAYLAERAGSYAFYETEVWMKSLPVFVVAGVTFLILIVLAWRNGRTYCNTSCPVGTVLGFLARYSWLRPVIDVKKCNHCGLCARRCKAACIDPEEHRIDYSRCVVCLDCIDTCKHGAVTYRPRWQKKVDRTIDGETKADTGRRGFLAGAGLMFVAGTVKAQEKKVDGGLAVILDKQVPVRETSLVPPGAQGLRNMISHCTGCQLCVSVCPNQVLRPSGKALTLMQPEMSYERGYCRPECTKCSEVCPAGAILKVSPAEKSAIQIGHAVWVRKNCLPLTDGVDCGNCARHCPVGAITMVASDPDRPDVPRIPVVNTERCIGCGACENLCPARPFSAIYVEGHECHRTI